MLTGGSDDEAKLASLKFLGHWVGDIHQLKRAGVRLANLLNLSLGR